MELSASFANLGILGFILTSGLTDSFHQFILQLLSLSLCVSSSLQLIPYELMMNESSYMLFDAFVVYFHFFCCL